MCGGGRGGRREGREGEKGRGEGEEEDLWVGGWGRGRGRRGGGEGEGGGTQGSRVCRGPTLGPSWMGNVLPRARRQFVHVQAGKGHENWEPSVRRGPCNCAAKNTAWLECRPV